MLPRSLYTARPEQHLKVPINSCLAAGRAPPPPPRLSLSPPEREEIRRDPSRDCGAGDGIPPPKGKTKKKKKKQITQHAARRDGFPNTLILFSLSDSSNTAHRLAHHYQSEVASSREGGSEQPAILHSLLLSAATEPTPLSLSLSPSFPPSLPPSPSRRGAGVLRA